MSVEIRQLKDKGTGTPFVPITHWDAVGGKPNVATMSDVTNALATKQDVLTAGDNIEIDSAGTISATGVTSATEQVLENMSFVISSNINELDGRLIAVESGKQAASDNNLNTTNKTLVGAINELLARIEALETRLNNQA